MTANSQQFEAHRKHDDGVLDVVDHRLYPLGTLWASYSLDSTPTAIRVQFEKHHGYPPDVVVRSGPLLLAGPLRPANRDAAACRVVAGEQACTPEASHAD